MSTRRVLLVFFLAALVVTLPLLLAGCGPTITAPPTGGQPPTGGEDLLTRIYNSLDLIFGQGNYEFGLDSFHLEATKSYPQVSFTTNQIEMKNWTISADVSGDDIHFIYTSDGETTEGYIIDGGLGKGGQDFIVEGGQVKQDLGGVEVIWSANVSFGVFEPFNIAYSGISPQGTENIAGRAAEKYGLDSALSGLRPLSEFGYTYSRGTVWVDQQTGSMLKIVLDFEYKFPDPNDPTKELGTANGHVEVNVTRVGQVTVELP